MKHVICICWAISFLIITVDARGHGVRADIISNKGILVEAEYSDGESMSYASVEVFCCDEKLPFQNGRTDRNGRFLFLPDKSGKWKIYVKDEMGHQLTLKTSIDENSSILVVDNNHCHSYPKSQKALTGIAVISGIFGFFFWWKGRKNPFKYK